MLALHDLGQVGRYADYVVAMKNGRIVATGTPQDVITPELVRDVFDIDCNVVADPVIGSPLVLPHGHPNVDSIAMAGVSQPVG